MSDENWITGYTITEEDNTHGFDIPSESGGSGDISVVAVTENEGGVLDKTWNELKTIILQNKIIIIPFANDEDGYYGCAIIHAVYIDTTYYVNAWYGEASVNYSCETADGYPVRYLG